jgi:HEAT repeat protein
MLVSTSTVVLLLAVGVGIYWMWPGGKVASQSEDTSVESLDLASKIPTVTPINTRVVALLPISASIEQLPMPSVERAWEQLIVMPAVQGLGQRPQAAKIVRQPGKLIRRRIVAEDDLRDQLAQAPEVGLTVRNVQMIADAYDANTKIGATDFQPGVLLQVRPDLSTLPIRAKQLDPGAAATLGKLSKKLHKYVDNATPKDAKGQRLDPVLLREILHEEKRGSRLEWLRPEAVPVLRQLLGHEQTPIRRLLVELLSEIDGHRSSELLAERAVFDLNSEVRAAAIEALRSRPRDKYRYFFMAALRYPWAPAADHAAEALIALDDQEALPQLVTLLDLPDPSAPYAGSRGDHLQRQLMRVNHSASCLMCHAPALSSRDPVIGVVPGLQRLRTGGGGWGGRQPGVDPFWVRADVTFFRQDFSETIAVSLPGYAVQPPLRFDFMIRTRVVPPKDVKRLEEKYALLASYEQRDAVLFALRQLTGQNPGNEYEHWLELYPTAEVDAKSARLLDKFLKSSTSQRDQILLQFRDGKGAAFTQALSRAIPKLPATEQPKARAALVKRLARISADALRDKLRDADPEVRRAAAAACRQCNDSSLVADLVPLLSDPAAPVSTEAKASLKGITGEDLGDSAEAWQTWLETEGSE